jgi:Na+/H+ antiporter NhaA
MIGRFGIGTTLSLLVRLVMKSSVQQMNVANDLVVLLTSFGATLIPKTWGSLGWKQASAAA